MTSGASGRIICSMTILIAALILAATSAHAVVCRERTDLTFCLTDVQYERLDLHWRDARGSIDGLKASEAARGRELLFAMNAGMYMTDLRPMGLTVIDGQQVVPLNTRTGRTNFYSQPNGVFYVSGQLAGILSTADYQRAKIKPTLATQSGPMLVRGSRIIRSAVVSPSSTSTYMRNAVCVFNPWQVAFVITNKPMTMYKFAQLLVDDMGCKEALYLDGAISSLYAPQINRHDKGTNTALFIAVSM